jgi:hypothetical protein
VGLDVIAGVPRKVGVIATPVVGAAWEASVRICDTRIFYVVIFETKDTTGGATKESDGKKDAKLWIQDMTGRIPGPML